MDRVSPESHTTFNEEVSTESQTTFRERVTFSMMGKSSEFQQSVIPYHPFHEDTKSHTIFQ